MKFDEAYQELEKALVDPIERVRQQPRPVDEAANLAILQALVGGSNFKGKGRR